MASYLNSVQQKTITVPTLINFKAQAEKIVMLTCYDASFAALMNRCGVDVLLIGDSLGMVCQGQTSTLPVTLKEMRYHTASVAHGNQHCLVIADLPFGSYATPESAMKSAVQLMQSGAQMVKLEGGVWLAPTIQFLTERSVPVCAHIGLTPNRYTKWAAIKCREKQVTLLIY